MANFPHLAYLGTVPNLLSSHSSTHLNFPGVFHLGNGFSMKFLLRRYMIFMEDRLPVDMVFLEITNYSAEFRSQ